MKKTKYIISLFLFVALITTAVFGATKKVSAQRQNFINSALKYRGVPYVYGGKSPKGFDCSGYVSYVVANFTEYKMSGSAQSIYDSVTHIDAKQREPGDLIFFRTTGGTRISHVGIYLGRYTKEGTFHNKYVFVHAASDGPKTGVIVSSIDEKFWKEHFAGYGRFMPSSSGK